MSQIIKNFIIAITTLVIMSGCEDYATKVDLPKVEKKIVVHSFISPDDSMVSALITWSRPIIGTTDQAEMDRILFAVVTISDGIKTDTLRWDASNQLYEIAASVFPIEAGKKYFLSVTSPDGKHAKASCVVPFTKNTTLVLNRIDSSLVNQEITLSFQYKDHEPTINNYYCLIGKSDVGYSYFYGELLYKSDSELEENNYFKFSINYGYYYQKKAKAWLLNCDYNYFQYHKSLIAAENNFGIFTEPSLIFSNIEGGLGCFGAYYSYELEVNL